MKRPSLTKIIVSLIVLLNVACERACMRSEAELPIYGSKVIVTAVGEKEVVSPKIADFVLTDQAGEEVTLATFKGKICLVNFFCGTSKKSQSIMKEKISRLYEKYKDHDKVALLSLKLTPAHDHHDNVEFLKAYATELGIKDNHTWHLATGDKATIYKLAADLFVAVKENKVEDNEEDKTRESQEEREAVEHDQVISMVYEGQLRGRYSIEHPHFWFDNLSFDAVKLLERYKKMKKTLWGSVKWIYCRCTGGDGQ